MSQSDPPQPRWGTDETGAFAIWAPGQDRLRLDRAGHQPLPLTRRPDGWHVAPAGTLAGGDRYAILQADRRRPDPASHAQPDGPAAPSQVVAPEFPWTDAAWTGRPWHETVLYELHIGTFTAEGTFAAAIAHLEHLARLGVTTIELMPVAEFPGSRNWGYDGVLPFAPFHGYGSPDDLRRLVDAAHAHGIAVVLDVVFNHFGPRDNAVADLVPEFFTEAHKTPWGGAIDFARQPVRAFFIQNALDWLENFHLDGLRLDAVQAIFDDGPTHFLDELAGRVRAAIPGRHIHLMLENDENQSKWLRRDGYDAQWNDDFHHVMRVLVAGRTDGYYRDYAEDPIGRLGRALAEGFSYQGQDESIHRPGLWRGTPSAHLPPTAFVNFLQNHDQVGNTPFGKRLAALASPPALRLGVATMLLGPAVPMLFMGEEWAAAEPFDYFCDYDDDLAAAVRNGRREEFAHLPEFSDPDQLKRLVDPNAASTRDGSVLDWTAPGRAPHGEWLAFYTALLALRRDRIVPLLPEIGGNAGRFETLGPAALRVTWDLRDGRSLHLAANFSDDPAAWNGPAGETLYALEPGPGLPPWSLRLVLSA